MNLTSFQLVNKFPTFKKTKGSHVPLSQVPATCPYPERVRSRSCPQTSIPEDLA